MGSFRTFGVVAAAAAALVALTPGTASALGGEQLGCRVVPAPGGTPITADNCYNVGAGNPGYTAGFQVLNQSGSYSYAWTVAPQDQNRIVGGCGSTDSFCSISASNIFRDIEVSVTLTQDGSSETVSATAEIEPYCSYGFC